MSDLINREDAIEILSERAESLRGMNGDLGGACRGAMRIIEALPSAEPERKWIPVNEALPNNAEHDWVLGQIRETDSGYLWIPKVVEYRELSDDWFEDSIGWLKKNPDHAFEVIAWMPLPEPWKGER